MNVSGPEHRVYLSLGSNIAAERNFPRAMDMLEHYVRVEAVSTVWETPPIGTDGPKFLNAAARIVTRQSPFQLKNFVLYRIEMLLGRVRTHDKNAPRPIDLDILVYDDTIWDAAIWQRAHLAIPLAELMPNLVDPATGKTLGETAQAMHPGPGFLRRPDVDLKR